MSLPRRREARNFRIHEMPALFSPWGGGRPITETYRNFFNPNICHSCKRDSKVLQRYVTDRDAGCLCNMIFYCTRLQKWKDNVNHEEICEILRKFSQSHPQFWQTDAQYILAWEVLLHTLYWNIDHLEVVLIGSEMQAVHINIVLCADCERRKRKFEVYGCRMSFHDYVYIMLPCNIPNVIIAFEADISDWDLQADIIFKLKIQFCPLIVTAGSNSKFERNIQALREILRTPLNLTPIENTFSSLKAHRNFEDDDVSYRNKFLLIFKSISHLFNLYID
ncbi:uncharacterized protein LOC105186950 isoform X2 [Harpegnathos saltator]|uniref:uncharacterized protein LOC105186950 isoform X2 n=1 Tax=Harpegnathos saltator TaxID=610380 RepID=UPI000DBEDF38|nr:uncharacterized protein LOC105186950 isoform X2 [Harpegnathos saltator]